MDKKTLALLLAVRQALILVLGAVEDYLGIQRSIPLSKKQ